MTNIIPTEKQIQEQAEQVFPMDKKLQASYIQGVWNTIYKMKNNKKSKKCQNQQN